MERREFVKRTGIASMAGIVTTFGLSSFTSKNDDTSDTRFNVKDFGAIGDGKTSDSKAIQQALERAAQVNGTVWFPAGIYRCHNLKVPAYVTLLADPVWIFHTELDDDEADCMLDITGSFGVRIHGLVLRGIPEAKKQIHGIYLNNPEHWSNKEDTIVIDDTKVMDFSGHGVFFRRVWLFIVRHSQFMSNKGDGIRLLGWDGFVTDNQFSGNGGNGFGCDDCGATVMFTANRVEWNRGYGLFIHNGDDWNVTGNSFDRNHGAGLYALKVSAATVTGNVFRRCGKDSSYLAHGEHSCQVMMEDCHGISMTGNACLAGQDDGGHGLFTPQVGFIVKKMSHSVITGNTLWNGYMDTMIIDEGEHGEDFIMKDNVGCAKKL